MTVPYPPWKKLKSAEVCKTGKIQILERHCHTHGDANTQIHTLCAQIPNPQQGTHTTRHKVCKKYPYNRLLPIHNQDCCFILKDIKSMQKRDEEYIKYSTHSYQFNWYCSVTGHFFLWLSKMHFDLRILQFCEYWLDWSNRKKFCKISIHFWPCAI